jgi:hypothetical protein
MEAMHTKSNASAQVTSVCKVTNANAEHVKGSLVVEGYEGSM